MWRQEILRITLVGVILGSLGVFLWKHAHHRPTDRLASSSASQPNGPDSARPPGLNPSEPLNPSHSAQSRWSAGVGEVPSSGTDSPLWVHGDFQTGGLSSPPPQDRENEFHSVGESAGVTKSSAPASEGSSSELVESSFSEPSTQRAEGQEFPPPERVPLAWLPDKPKEEGSPPLEESAAANTSPPQQTPPNPPAPSPQAPTKQNESSLPEVDFMPTDPAPLVAGDRPEDSLLPEAPAVEPASETHSQNLTGNNDASAASGSLRLLATVPPEPTEPSESLKEDAPLKKPMEDYPSISITGMKKPTLSGPPTEGSPTPSGFAPNKSAAIEPSPTPSAELADVDFPQPERIPSVEPSGLRPATPLHQTPSGTAALPSSPPVSPKADQPPSKNLSSRPQGESCCWGCGGSTIRKQAAQAHKTLFYDNQFDYLEDPNVEETYLGDCLKRVQPTPWAILDLGGEYRLRHHSERNHRGTGLTGLDDDFLLHRTRIYANLELGELARIYAEMNDALSTNETYRPRPMEEDRTELQNLWIEVPILGFRKDGVVARLGRQELLYGAGRLVSPLDWANTRRTFEGYKLFWQGSVWTLDAFWVRPVYPNPAAFDSPDQSQQFLGLYLVRRLGEQALVEGYYLRLVEEDGLPDFDFHTLGLRSQQEYNGWLGELEAAVQFGSYGAFDHIAGMYTIGVGRRFLCLPGQPVFWTYYDWASGDPQQGNGFHHLFADSHQYLGAMDLFGRRNIEDWSFHLLVHPGEDWTLRLAWHIFHRQHPQDVPYGVDMRPLVASPGGSGDYGQELDVVLQWAIRPRAEILFGYSRFFAGEFFRTNPTPSPYQHNADFFYTQFSLRF